MNIITVIIDGLVVPGPRVSDNGIFLDRWGLAELGRTGPVEIETNDPRSSAVEDLPFVAFVNKLRSWTGNM